MEFRVVGPADEAILAEIFADIDETFFRPHPFTLDPPQLRLTGSLRVRTIIWQTDVEIATIRPARAGLAGGSSQSKRVLGVHDLPSRCIRPSDRACES